MSYFADIDVKDRTLFDETKVGSAIAEVFEHEGSKEYHIIGCVALRKAAEPAFREDFGVGQIFHIDTDRERNIGLQISERVLSREEEVSYDVYKMKTDFDKIRAFSEVKVQTYITKWDENGTYLGVEKNHLYGKEDGVPTNVTAAEKWVLENHPDEYPGVNIWQCCPGGDRFYNDFGLGGKEEEGRDIAEAEQKGFIKEAMEKFGIESDRDEEIERE
jgi:hypothetical protein